MMSEKKKVPVPKVLQSFVKSIYLVGMTFVLTLFFMIVGVWVYGVNYPDIFLLYVILQILVIWVFANGNIKISEFEW